MPRFLGVSELPERRSICIWMESPKNARTDSPVNSNSFTLMTAMISNAAQTSWYSECNDECLKLIEAKFRFADELCSLFELKYTTSRLKDDDIYHFPTS
ncbi:predicted protein [Sclerotinia sclerotiorum 1980 UF-70]|uniref:Uncharacterized protein n=1 Tax=Sclerotinia sclerotiorum (strain ATCC 18683 / 1980 / Ss-1) TaxID=665079 RepID=A7F0U2_SCLS1|nr:predicted protein [Sclerotinia sclerotiorum 1980 UF-70]EDN95334.1 predicted protein [Sclerotinia sclerotiorum 1980 UF-70]